MGSILFIFLQHDTLQEGCASQPSKLTWIWIINCLSSLEASSLVCITIVTLCLMWSDKKAPKDPVIWNDSLLFYYICEGKKKDNNQDPLICRVQLHCLHIVLCMLSLTSVLGAEWSSCSMCAVCCHPQQDYTAKKSLMLHVHSGGEKLDWRDQTEAWNVSRAGGIVGTITLKPPSWCNHLCVWVCGVHICGWFVSALSELEAT